MVNITLICWQCGKRKRITASDRPHLGIELINMACSVKWKGVSDLDHGRSIIFCSDECCQKARKKDGTFRLRPKVQKD